MTARAVCIVGFSEISRTWADEQPLDVDIWGMNEAHTFMKREAACWFQIHPRDWHEEQKEKLFNRKLTEDSKNSFGRNVTHTDWLRECQVPVYMREHYPDFPMSVPYPYEAIRQEFGVVKGENGTKSLYLTSTPAYMIALAIHQGYEEIRIAGIELAIGTEYFYQRACLEWYMGIARGRGINIVFPPMGCSILGAPVYAQDDALPMPKDFVFDPRPLQLTVGGADGVELPKVNIGEVAGVTVAGA